MKIWSKFAALFRKDKLDAEMSEEMSAHLELQTAENVKRGMSDDKARYAARREFGGVEQIKERARDERARGFIWLEHLAQDLRYAVRQLRKNPGFTVVVVLSIAFGIGANSAIFSLIDDQLLSRLPVKNPHELVLFQWVAGPQGRPGSDGGDAGADNLDPETGKRTRRVFSMRTFEAFRAADSALTDVFAVCAVWSSRVIVDGHAEMIGSGELVSGNYFAALGVSALRGRTLGPDDDRAGAAPVAVISHRYWQTRFGSDPQAVGKTITLNQTPVTVVGILPQDFRGVIFDGGADLTLPLVLAPHVRYEGEPQTKPQHWWLRIMGRLKPGATLAQAQASVEGAFEISAREGMRHSVKLPRLRAIAGGYKGTEADRKAKAGTLKIATGISALVLLAACVNAANLLLARSAARRRELAVRLALGASRSRLVCQLLTESVLLALLGAALGLLLGRWGLDLLAMGRPPLGGWVVGFATLLAGLTGVGFGLVPALRATRLDLTQEFQGGVRLSGGARSRLGGALVVVQVALSLILLVGAGLFARTVRNLRTVDVGFDRTHLLLFGVDGTVAGYKSAQESTLNRRIAERIGALPGVRATTFSGWPMLSGWSGSTTDLSIPGYPLPSGKSEDVTLQTVGLDFFSTYGIPLVAGRAFERHDSAKKPKVAIVNQTLARKYFGDENPVGQHLGGQGTGSTLR